MGGVCEQLVSIYFKCNVRIDLGTTWITFDVSQSWRRHYVPLYIRIEVFQVNAYGYMVAWIFLLIYVNEINLLTLQISSRLVINIMLCPFFNPRPFACTAHRSYKKDPVLKRPIGVLMTLWSFLQEREAWVHPLETVNGPWAKGLGLKTDKGLYRDHLGIYYFKNQIYVISP